MELKDFIKYTLINVVEGVKDANEDYKKSRGGDIIKFDLTGDKPPIKHTNDISKVGTYIDFDIVLVINEETGDKGKAAIGVFSGMFGGGLSSETQNKQSAENTHRLKFKVFVEDNKK